MLLFIDLSNMKAVVNKLVISVLFNPCWFSFKLNLTAFSIVPDGVLRSN